MQVGGEVESSAFRVGAIHRRLFRYHVEEGPVSQAIYRPLYSHVKRQGELQENELKVAIIHYWLVNMRGGERVLEEILRLFPEADIFTHVADRTQLSPAIAKHRITETSIARLPGAVKHYQKYLGFMPRALEELDLRGYDLIISSESGPAKGVIPPPDSRHICYMHSPMRYIWDQYHHYKEGLGRLQKIYFSHLAHNLRQWDVSSSTRVDKFIANSSFVANRVNRYYRRDADVLHPPVDLNAYQLPTNEGERSYYLFVSQLVPYKRADLAIEAFRNIDYPLKVVGDGSDKANLQGNLPANVELLGRVQGADLRRLYQGAKALIFPAEEDFGIVPIEAMACGTPVLAYRRGGAGETVKEGVTGLFFETQDASAIRDAVTRFESGRREWVDPTRINAYAQRFGAERFRTRFKAIVDEVMS